MGKRARSTGRAAVPEEVVASAAQLVGEEHARALAKRSRSERSFLRAVLVEAASRAALDDRLPRGAAPPRRIDRALNETPPALFLVDASERFLYVNRAAELFTGRPRSELIGRTIDEALGPSDLGEQFSVVVRRARSGGQPLEYEAVYEIESGAHFEIGFTAALAGSPSDSPEGADVVVVGRDLHAPAEHLRLRARPSLSAEVEADLRGRLRQVERQMARSERLVAIGQMAAGFVHEINNPLGALSGLVEILQMDIPPEEPAGQVLGGMGSEIARIRRIAEDMLDLARSSAGEGAEAFAPFELAGVVRSVIKLMGPQLRVARVKVETETATDPAWVFGGEDRIRQVLMNLILNAVQAMSPPEVHPPPGGRLIVRVLGDRVRPDDLPPRPSRAEDIAQGGPDAIREEAERRAAGDASPPWREGLELVRLEVEDTGPGIPEDELSHLFEPFFTTKVPGEGTGLGLSTAEAVVRAHGGTIAAENAPGGARFVVRLPACAPPGDEGQKRKTGRHRRAGE